MKSDKPVAIDVDHYIESFPRKISEILEKLRQIVLESASAAEESISYGMPAYKLNGRPLIYFAAFKSHIGFYATPSGHAAFDKELGKYKQGKGSVQFPYDQPMPYALVKKIVMYRAKENAEMGSKKK